MSWHPILRAAAHSHRRPTLCMVRKVSVTASEPARTARAGRHNTKSREKILSSAVGQNVAFRVTEGSISKEANTRRGGCGAALSVPCCYHSVRRCRWGKIFSCNAFRSIPPLTHLAAEGLVVPRRMPIALWNNNDFKCQLYHVEAEPAEYLYQFVVVKPVQVRRRRS
jgi:hypothetical protein